MLRPFLLLLAILATANASIFLPTTSVRSLADTGRSSSADVAFHRRRNANRVLKSRAIAADGKPLAIAIPGNSVAEQVVIGGFGNFIAIYNSVITARILLSWFPQAQSVGFLQPVFQITDPYLNLFRGIIPPIFGLDFSPILAFVTLNLLQTSAVSLAAEVPKEMREKLEKERWGVVGKKRFGF
ncbi:hypothetical protein ACHAWO_007037 [Cyclotella atomus]|uniref:Uncharacterized protein n=1 Tax=Cyclotella atomus TaxID=382360 RepID=A0ABD3MVL7_9STRA